MLVPFGLKNKARKHSIVISDETNKVLQLSNPGDVDLSYEHIAFMWGWFAVVDCSIFHTSEKMEQYTTLWLSIIADSLGPGIMDSIMQARLNFCQEAFKQVENQVGKPSIYPMVSQIAVDYLNKNGYNAKIETLLEAIQKISTTV